MASPADNSQPNSSPSAAPLNEKPAVPEAGREAPSGKEDTSRRNIRIGSQRYQAPSYGERKAPLAPVAPAMPIVAPAMPIVASAMPNKETAQTAPPNRETAQSGDVPAAGAGLPASGTVAGPGDTVSAAAGEGESSSAAARRMREPVPRPAAPTRADINRMSAELEAEVNAALGGLSLDQMIAGEAAPSEDVLQPEAKVRAQVAKIHNDDVFLNLPGRKQGIASLRQFARAPQEGDSLEVVISKFNSDDGMYEVSVPGGATNVENWNDVAEGTVVEARVTAVNPGGLECQVNTLRGFIPASQVALYRSENLAEFMDQKLLCVVTEANPERRNLVLSRKAVLEREQHETRKQMLSSLEVGMVREGIVRRLQDFGAFVDIGGIDGLVHVSQLSWERIKHPSEVLSEGQKIQVRVEKIDPVTGKIGLSYRNTQESPWVKAAQKYPVAGVVKGTVSKLAEFGAFVKLEPGIEGLVHISELAFHRVSRASTVVQVGEEVEVKVLSIDAENQRMSLSLRQAKAQAVVEEKPEEVEEEEVAPPPVKTGPTKPLKGGLGRGSGGAQFGLKW